jgi:hypothetical protein
MQEETSIKRGISSRPPGQVYHMPGASDAFVSGFRTWLNSVGGGGPFGPMDEAWLVAAGPRQPLDSLLDHYHSHTKNCSICTAALKRVKAAKIVARALAVAGAVAALASAATQWIATGQLPAAAGRAAAIMAWGIAAAVVGGAAWRWCNKTIERFYKGKSLPARNIVAGEFVPAPAI